jgi:hypothetical protein
VMHWFRARLRSSSCVALFALALQLVLSFGHVHVHDILGHAPAQIETSGAATPATSDTPEQADGYCAICAIIHLAGTLVPASVPSLPLPLAYGRAQPRTTVLVDAPTQTPSFFAARAPPVG